MSKTKRDGVSERSVVGVPRKILRLILDSRKLPQKLPKDDDEVRRSWDVRTEVDWIDGVEEERENQ